jgi:hypothetical protein
MPSGKLGCDSCGGRSAEVGGGQPPEARRALVLRRPHGPAIAVPRERLGCRAVAMLRPAHDAVDRVNARRRLLPPQRGPARMAERSQVQKQGDFASGLAREHERGARAGIRPTNSKPLVLAF